ncbi:pilus assembly protein CpaE [Curtobacterium sp. MCBD17_040]|uniref:pilus assembly protein CpaE n=1 Tax=Curtobacterium sp. MCBD17_040 TaxID=2175674 RepID=UPI000DAA9052|nr:pilus assembly protein CpaE [Curtobacterium sp. MCBD17_040]WIB64085.1 pilus assembly protein CpaE [Curtobacterium sp. MCBD17_040]
MISVDLARTLREAGLRWHPETGDRFVIDKPGVDDDVYTVSEMTIEKHEYPSGTILGFNGTTEWALDSVAADDALWIPREDQLRTLLGPAFVGLTRIDTAAQGVVHTVTCRIDDVERTFAAPDAATAYGEALRSYITASLAI